MATCIAIRTGGSGQGPELTVEMEESGVWRLRGPFPPDYRRLVPEAAGRWRNTIGDMIHLNGSDGKMLIELRGRGGREGWAYAGLQPNGSFAFQSRWRRVAKPLPANGLGLWVGLAVKGGGEVVLGAEGVLAVAVSAGNLQRWFAFGMLSGRAGIAGGISGSGSLVVLTGVDRPADLHHSIQSGSDWAVSIGGRWAQMAKGLSGLEDLKELGKLVIFALDHADQLVTLGKGVYQEACLDYEEQNLLIVDTPAGAGLELGYYWWAGTVYVLTEGAGKPTPQQIHSARRRG